MNDDFEIKDEIESFHMKMDYSISLGSMDDEIVVMI